LYKRLRLVSGAIDYVFKLGDFGISRTYNVNDEVSPFDLTAQFQAPWIRSTTYGPNIDLYSLGDVMKWLTDTQYEPDPEFVRLHTELRMPDEFARPDANTLFEIARQKVEGWKDGSM
jgi:serine/threonine protein kinase